MLRASRLLSFSSRCRSPPIQLVELVRPPFFFFFLIPQVSPLTIGSRPLPNIVPCVVVKPLSPPLRKRSQKVLDIFSLELKSCLSACCLHLFPAYFQRLSPAKSFFLFSAIFHRIDHVALVPFPVSPCPFWLLNQRSLFPPTLSGQTRSFGDACFSRRVFLFPPQSSINPSSFENLPPSASFT